MLMNGGQDLDHTLTPHRVQDFMSRVLALMARHFRGDSTLNHLRIGNYIGLRDLFDGTATTNKEISEALGIPTSTVSRIVTELMKRGYVAETLHPDDHRIRLLRIVPGHPLAQGFETELHMLLREMLGQEPPVGPE